MHYSAQFFIYDLHDLLNLDAQDFWPLALSRRQTERQPPRSDALRSAVAIGSPVSSRTWVIHIFGRLPRGLGFKKSSR